MSNDETTDLTELFEYDEFDSYDSQTYPTIDAIHAACGGNSGVPLSVELSQCLNKSTEQSTSNTSLANDNFVKAPEIFLRIDGNNSGGGITSVHGNLAQPQIHDEQSNSIDSIDSCRDVLNPSIDRDQCYELQYEDEFIDSNDENECDSSNVVYERRNSIESDYEQLLLEGINLTNKKYPWKLFYYFKWASKRFDENGGQFSVFPIGVANHWRITDCFDPFRQY